MRFKRVQMQTLGVSSLLKVDVKQTVGRKTHALMRRVGLHIKKKKQQPAAAFRGAFERAAQAVDPNLAADKARPGL